MRWDARERAAWWVLVHSELGVGWDARECAVWWVLVHSDVVVRRG